VEEGCHQLKNQWWGLSVIGGVPRVEGKEQRGTYQNSEGGGVWDSLSCRGGCQGGDLGSGMGDM